MAGSAIRASHVTGDARVQDPYCLRCQPQVMGACLTLLRQAGATLETEANGVTDNPLIFADTDEALSGGNFHAEPVALDRKSVVEGKSVSVRVDPGGRRLIKKKIYTKMKQNQN